MTAVEKINIITIEDYEAMPENERAEVVDGEVRMMSSPSRVHQEILSVLHFKIYSYIQKRKGECKVFTAPFDVMLEKEPLVIVQPDIMVICDKSKLDEKRCNGAPDFVIEIVSPSNAMYDYITKSNLYFQSGVREYWIVDPVRKTVTVSFFEGEKPNMHYTFEDSVKVNIYDDLYIDFKEMQDIL
jgi:Uma2 family endonuclease